MRATPISFRNLSWLFPVAVALHNCEEAIEMPQWVAQNSDRIPVHVRAGPGEIRLALSILTLAALAVTYLSHRFGKQSFWTYLLFGGIVAMLINVFVPHVPASIAFRAYTPGVITAVAINLPVMSVLVVSALREGWVSGGKALLYAAAVPLVLATTILLLFSR